MVEGVIEKYRLSPHPEGGWFRETYRSGQTVPSSESGGRRSAVTHIYFMLAQGQISRLHRVVHDEIWHFYEGAPMKLIRFDGNRLWEETFGPECDAYAAAVPGGTWQAAESTGSYTLAGCTVAPGFDFRDFSFLRDGAEERFRLERDFPAHARFL